MVAEPSLKEDIRPEHEEGNLEGLIFQVACLERQNEVSMQLLLSCKGCIQSECRKG